MRESWVIDLGLLLVEDERGIGVPLLLTRGLIVDMVFDQAIDAGEEGVEAGHGEAALGDGGFEIEGVLVLLEIGFESWRRR